MPFGVYAGDFLLSHTRIDSTALTCDSEETCLCLVVILTSLLNLYFRAFLQKQQVNTDLTGSVRTVCIQTRHLSGTSSVCHLMITALAEAVYKGVSAQ